MWVLLGGYVWVLWGEGLDAGPTGLGWVCVGAVGRYVWPWWGGGVPWVPPWVGLGQRWGGSS